MRDPNTQLPRKIGGAPLVQGGDSNAPTAKAQPIPFELIGNLNDDGTPDLKALEKHGLLPKFLRLWNNPALLQRLKTAVQQLKTEKIDLKDEKSVKGWLEKQEAAATVPAKVEQATVASTVGRNDPCPCGSKKKFKKCCDGK